MSQKTFPVAMDYLTRSYFARFKKKFKILGVRNSF